MDLLPNSIAEMRHRRGEAPCISGTSLVGQLVTADNTYSRMRFARARRSHFRV
jgi:hypothetical protein